VSNMWVSFRPILLCCRSVPYCVDRRLLTPWASQTPRIWRSINREVTSDEIYYMYVVFIYFDVWLNGTLNKNSNSNSNLIEHVFILLNGISKTTFPGMSL
jgi:hypothetical protein